MKWITRHVKWATPKAVAALLHPSREASMRPGEAVAALQHPSREVSPVGRDTRCSKLSHGQYEVYRTSTRKVHVPEKWT